MSNQPKWTPGPWKWWTSNSWRRLKRDACGVTQSVLEPYVCKDGHPDCSVSDADMDLMAAAPELYEAALNAEQTIADFIGMYGDGGAGLILQQLREAMAKARGES